MKEVPANIQQQLLTFQANMAAVGQLDRETYGEMHAEYDKILSGLEQKGMDVSKFQTGQRYTDPVLPTPEELEAKKRNAISRTEARIRAEENRSVPINIASYNPNSADSNQPDAGTKVFIVCKQDGVDYICTTVRNEFTFLRGQQYYPRWERTNTSTRDRVAYQIIHASDIAPTAMRIVANLPRPAGPIDPGLIAQYGHKYWTDILDNGFIATASDWEYKSSDERRVASSVVLVDIGSNSDLGDLHSGNEVYIRNLFHNKWLGIRDGYLVTRNDNESRGRFRFVVVDQAYQNAPMSADQVEQKRRQIAPSFDKYFKGEISITQLLAEIGTTIVPWLLKEFIKVALDALIAVLRWLLTLVKDIIAEAIPVEWWLYGIAGVLVAIKITKSV